MKVTVTFMVDNVEVDDKFRKLCHTYANYEEVMADKPLFNELVDATKKALKDLGYDVSFMDSIESADGWTLYNA